MNVIVKSPIRISSTETLPAGKTISSDVLGTSFAYLLERGCVVPAAEKVIEKVEEQPEKVVDPPAPPDPPARKKF